MAFGVRFNHEKRDSITGEAVGAFVMIYDQSSGDTLSADLVGDFRNTSETELVQAVLENFYKRYFADKAMAEAVQTVDDLKIKTKELDRWKETMEERVNVAENDRRERFDQAMAAIAQTEGALVEFMTNIVPHLMTLLPEEVLESMEAGNEPTAINEAQAESN